MWSGVCQPPLILVVHTPTVCVPMRASLRSSSTRITRQMDRTMLSWRIAFRGASCRATTFQARIAECIQVASQDGVASKHLLGSIAIHTCHLAAVHALQEALDHAVETVVSCEIV